MDCKALVHVINALLEHVPRNSKRTLRLPNGKEYTVVVPEAAKRSKYFEAMFRAGAFAESKDDGTPVDVDLPFNDHFESIYAFLMTGAQSEMSLQARSVPTQIAASQPA